jgi:hypothetical protein
MFYFLIFHTSISASKDIERKTLITFLYGSVMYIILHAILTSCDNNTFVQIIKKYFWLIIGLDIISMGFVYKTLINTHGHNIAAKFMTFFEGLADTSMYTPVPNEIDPVPEIPGSSIEEDESVSDPAVLVNNNNRIKLPKSILKKNCTIVEDNNQVIQINSNEPVAATSNNPLNDELMQLSSEFITTSSNTPPATNPAHLLPPPIETSSVSSSPPNNFPAPIETRKTKSATAAATIARTGTSDIKLDINADYNARMMEYGSQSLQATNPGASPNPIASTSINEIRKKAISAGSQNATDVLMNRDNLTNEDIEKIKLNYDPNDVLKLYGYDSSSNNQNAMQDALNYQQDSSDDKVSMVSSISDLGSAMDIDLSEFASAV